MSLTKQIHYGESDERNMIILGDNYKVCSELRNEYKDKIKCIYLDPPYNNGETFDHYRDDLAHNVWIDNMSKVIPVLFSLLHPNGSLWISIGDYELHYLKVACDNAIGRNKYVATIIWQQRNTRENRKTFSNNHEYILVYAKNPSEFKKTRKLLPPDSSVFKRYVNPDDDPRGPWQSVTLNVQAGHAVESQFYEIISPNGKRHYPPNGRCWIYNSDRMIKEIEAGNVWFGEHGNNVPRLKKFLSQSTLGVAPNTVWLSSEVGTSQSAKKQLLKMFPSLPPFGTPKPEELIQRILTIATNPGDIVLDAFLGSGTTAAVAQKMRRKFIGIDNSTKSITYSVDRMKQVIDGDLSGISRSESWYGGGGFSLYNNSDQ